MSGFYINFLQYQKIDYDLKKYKYYIIVSNNEFTKISGS
jgi:hypothetical protein